MSKFCRYPTYADSGIDWLGEIPASWRIERAKGIFREVNERSVDGTEQLLSVSEYFGVKPRAQVIAEGEYISRAESLEGYKKCRVNDLVMNIMLAWKRGLAFTKYEGIVSPSYSVFRLVKGYDPAYLNYLLRTDLYITLFKRWSTGVIDSRLRLYPEVFTSLPIIIPPEEEQHVIAEFLDHETAKIDHLIAKQERLIELLKEKRQAVISHAVTKGLNPDAPMKDSGVEWLGEVPAHWGILQLKRLLKGIDYGISDSGDSSGTFEVLGMGDIQEGKVTCPGKKFVDKVDAGLLLEFNDILFNRTNSLALVGKSGIYKGKGSELVTFASYLVRFRVREGVNPDYLNYLLNIPTVLAQARSLALPSISQANLNPNRYAYIHLCLPSRHEQDKIVHIIEKRGQLFSKLINKAEKSVELMKEHRTALISAAVTGKIDVRDWKKPEQKSHQTAKTATG